MRQLQLLAGLLRRRAARSGRGNVSIEFALVSVFVLLPLFAGGTDFVLIMSAQAQLRTALQALDYFAWTNPGDADQYDRCGLHYQPHQPGSQTTGHAPHDALEGGANGGLSYGCFTLPASASMAIPPPPGDHLPIHANAADSRDISGHDARFSARAVAGLLSLTSGTSALTSTVQKF